MSAPPSLPPQPSGMSPGAAPPKKKLSGCAIAAIVLAVVGVVGLALLGILAAIAIPQYQDYVLRTQVAQISVAASSLQVSIETHIAESGACPDPDTFAALAGEPVEAGSETSRLTGRWEWIDGNDGRCAFSLVFARPGHRIDGTHLVFRRQDDGIWTCNEGTLPAEYRRLGCSSVAPTTAN